MTPDISTLLKDITSSNILDRRYQWTVFRAFNFYRLILVLLLVGIFLLDEGNRFFGKANSLLFLGTAVVYMVLVVLAIVGSYRRRPLLRVQAQVQTIVDLIALGLLVHASGNIGSNLSILMVTAVAASGILLPLYSALAMAALAFLILLGYTFSMVAASFTAAGATSLWSGRFGAYLQTYDADWERLGILGASCFIAALLTYTLAERSRRTEALARQRSQQLLEMAQINQAIVQHLHSGIIIVDQSARVRLMNDTAHRLLNHAESAEGVALETLSPPLQQRLSQWLGSGVYSTKPFRQAGHLPELTVSFSEFGRKRLKDTLIALEDSSLMVQRLQQLKLAALGRMTASIAHEIRNPLTSISHAAQLLQESSTVSPGDRRLGQIVHDNAKRANKIINTVLELSRREGARPENIALETWLEEFHREFLNNHRQYQPQIEWVIEPPELRVYFDPLHLHQVLWNLCNNACVHGPSKDGPVRLRLVAGPGKADAGPWLDVYDEGPGIPEADNSKIFEPFFTTKTQGTGLGLYISREICEANNAQLQYIRPATGGSCFRITFAKANQPQENFEWMSALH
ncbi:MAG: ATP-binding protein [Candidatus Competibacteraceae bacterium]